MEDPLGSSRQAVEACEIWRKIKSADLHLITVDDVRRLFSALGAEDVIQADELLKLAEMDDLSLQVSDIKALVKDSDIDGSGEISVEAVHTVLTKGEVSFNLLKQAMFGADKQFKASQCHIDELMGCLHEEYDIKSNLWSLPQTVVLFLSFALAAILHLNALEAFHTGRVFSEATNYGDFLLWFVYDRDAMWTWMEQGWLRNTLRQDLLTFLHDSDSDPDGFRTNPFPGRVNRVHQVIGAVRIRRKYTLPTKCELGQFWSELYDPLTSGNCHQFGEELIDDWYLLYHEKHDTQVERILNRSAAFWVDANTTYLHIETLSFNAHQETFSLIKFMIEFEASGFLKMREGSRETFMANPYSGFEMALPDILYLLLIFNMFYGELKELIPAAMNGLDGVKDYLQFWNVVDWFAIMSGFATLSIWINVCLKVSRELPPVLASLPSDALDMEVFANKTYLTPEDVDRVVDRSSYEDTVRDVFAVAEDVTAWHRAVRWVILAYLFVLMLKLFKSFMANDRLSVVIKTLTDSAVDVMHFLIVTVSVFVCFAFSGLLIFGYNVYGFSNIPSSLFFCWREGVGMSDIEGFRFHYQVFAYFWVFAYQILVIRLMLNILLGLIFEAYGRVHSAAGQPMTLIEQVDDAVKTLKETKTFLDMWYILVELEDDDFPAHPAEVVTVRSLRKAFSKDKMTRANAEYLIQLSSQWAQKKAGVVTLSLSDGIRMLGQIKVNSMKLQAVSEQLNRIAHDHHAKSLDVASVVEADPGLHMVHHEHHVAEPATAVSISDALMPLQTADSNKSERRLQDTQGDVLNDQAATAEVLSNIKSLAATISTNQQAHDRAVKTILQDMELRSQHVHEREGWSLQKIKTMIDRCEQTEIGIGKLSECFNGIDFQMLRAMPDALSKLAVTFHDFRVSSSTKKSNNGGLQSAGSNLGGSGLQVANTNKQRNDTTVLMEQNLDLIAAEVDKLVEEANSQVNLRQALGHVDAAVRGLLSEHSSSSS